MDSQGFSPIRYLFPSLASLLLLASPLCAEDPPGDPGIVAAIPDLVAFWQFGEPEGEPRISSHTAERHPLQEGGKPVARVPQGPYSGYAAHLTGENYFLIPYADTKDLNISGADAEVTMFAVVKLDNLQRGRTIAGMWSEGKGAGDDSGTRQYSMLYNMPTYGGPDRLVPHISSEGGVTRRADGSAFPWCADYAATAHPIPVKEWVTLGFTYDGEYIRAYLNGRLDAQDLDPEKHRRDDPYFTTEGPDGGDRGMNPYYHGRGIFAYDPEKHADTKPMGGADFMVGARYVMGQLSEAGAMAQGQFGGLAVFSRALTDEEMATLHESANITALNKQ